MPRKTAAKPGKKSSSDEDVYEVDRILAHKMEGKKPMYLVKWKGWSPEHNSWLQERDLFCERLLKEYWARVRQSAPSPDRSRGSPTKSPKSTGKVSPAKATPRRRKNTDDSESDWDATVDVIETIEKDDTDELVAHIVWKNGSKSIVKTSVANHKCPQKMIQFYEAHLTFKNNDDTAEETETAE